MPTDFISRFVELERRVAEFERRARNRKRTGTVEAIDLKKGLARVKLLDGASPYLSPWVPWKEVSAGGTSTHIPPTVGQQVDLVSESGDLTDAVIDFSTHSSANPRPHDGPEAVIVHGETRIVVSDGKVRIIADVAIEGSLIIEGPSVSHNGTDIGDSHKHKQVAPGSGISGEPV